MRRCSQEDRAPQGRARRWRRRRWRGRWCGCVEGKGGAGLQVDGHDARTGRVGPHRDDDMLADAAAYVEGTADGAVAVNGGRAANARAAHGRRARRHGAAGARPAAAAQGAAGRGWVAGGGVEDQRRCGQSTQGGRQDASQEDSRDHQEEARSAPRLHERRPAGRRHVRAGGPGPSGLTPWPGQTLCSCRCRPAQRPRRARTCP